MSDYTMDDFRAEMAKRDVAAPTIVPHAKSSPPHGTRAHYIAQKCRCAACRAANSAYYHDLKARKRGDAPAPPAHGSSIVRTVACGVHPLHAVKIRANGTRSGCPMCEMQIEDLCRSLTPDPSTPHEQPTPRDHRPRINHERTMIVGCACGWRIPPGTTDSEDAYVEHVTVLR